MEEESWRESYGEEREEECQLDIEQMGREREKQTLAI